MFINKEHEDAYNLFVKKSNIDSDDIERKSLFYLLAMMGDTRKHVGDLYDFKNNWIKSDGLNKGWQTSGSLAVTRLGFNLYNGYKGEEDSICRVTPLDIFCSLGGEYLDCMFNAIKIRMGKETV